MCGILGYMGHKTIPITQALRALSILETEQEPNEPTPVGGHGAGIAYLNHKHEFTLFKAGRTKHSPVHDLKQQIRSLAATQSQIILGHVRRASPEFADTIQHAQCTQPYKPRCTNDLNFVSAHNGFLENYKQLKLQLQAKHHFESEPIKLIDSEIIPHYYEEQLTKTADPTKAAHSLYEHTQGRNTIVTLHIETNQAHLDVIQKGKTRGLVIWTNPNNEVLLCSREKPALNIFSPILTENSYQKIIHLTRSDSLNLEVHFTLTLSQHAQTSHLAT